MGQPIKTAADAQQVVDGAERAIREVAEREGVGPRTPNFAAVTNDIVDAVRGYLSSALGLVSSAHFASDVTDWRAARMTNGRLDEEVRGVGRVGTLVLYPQPRMRLVVSDSTQAARFEPEES